MHDGIDIAQLDLDTSERFQQLRRLLGVTTFGLNLIVLQPGEAGRVHRHERQEEVYLVLEGELSLVLDGDEQRLGRGAIARVAPDVRRQLVNRRPQRLALLALGGATAHEGRDGIAYASWDSHEGRPPQETPLPASVPVEPA